jgi:hypothetical protein
MMKIFLAAGVLFPAILLDPAAARAADIGVVTLVGSTCNSLTVKAHINFQWEQSPNPNNATYRAYNWNNVLNPVHVVSSDSNTLTVPNLQEKKSYRIMIEARSRKAGGWGIPIYRKVGDVTSTTPACSTPSTYTPVPGDVRLRHEATGKCLFGNPEDGGAVKTWGACWKDPGMAVSLETVSGSKVRIRIQAIGKCLFGNPTSGQVVKNWGCWNDPNMVYVKEDLGDNRLRLRHEITGQCMYGGTGNGDPVRNWPCGTDPNMVWVIDPF